MQFIVQLNGTSTAYNADAKHCSCILELKLFQFKYSVYLEMDLQFMQY